MKPKTIFTLIAVAVVALLPLVLSTYGIKMTSELFIMSIFALSLGLIMGYAGLASFGHAAFFGLGVYTVALLSQYISNTYVLILAAIVVSGLIALISGFVFIRSTGVYFFILTFAFNQLLFVIFYKMTNITGGEDGMSIRVTPDFGFGEITSPVAVYYLMFVSFLVCYALLHFFIQSPVGKIVIGAKVNDSRMRALGFNTYGYKVLVYTISGMLGGFSGALYAYFNSFASPDSLNLILSGQALIMVIVGGVGTLIGAPIGAALFVILENYISSYTERWPIVMGLIFVVVVLYGQGGIALIAKNLWNKFRAKRNTRIPSQTMNGSKGAGGKQA